jgi:hypothetical protein
LLTRHEEGEQLVSDREVEDLLVCGEPRSGPRRGPLDGRLVAGRARRQQGSGEKHAMGPPQRFLRPGRELQQYRRKGLAQMRKPLGRRPRLEMLQPLTLF